MKYYTIYKTTNNLNGKFYIGQHQTTILDDNYLGSGTSILNAIKKSRKGSKNNNACPVELYGKKYGTKKECYTSLGISKKKLNQILGDLKMKNNIGDRL